jgi:hypothetical protein
VSGEPDGPRPRRTPEEIARELLDGGLCAHGERNEFRHAYECEVCLPAAIRAAVAELRGCDEAMTPLAAEEIAELRRLENDAKRGPWRRDGIDIRTDDERCGDHGEWFVVFGDRDDPHSLDFIAASRNALLRLLDEVEQLRASVDKLTTAFGIGSGIVGLGR